MGQDTARRRREMRPRRGAGNQTCAPVTHIRPPITTRAMLVAAREISRIQTLGAAPCSARRRRGHCSSAMGAAPEPHRMGAPMTVSSLPARATTLLALAAVQPSPATAAIFPTPTPRSRSTVLRRASRRFPAMMASTSPPPATSPSPATRPMGRAGHLRSTPSATMHEASLPLPLRAQSTSPRPVT